MSTLKVNSIIPTGGVPTGGGGGIIQVVMGEQRNVVSTTVNSQATSSSALLSAQITPLSSTSKIKISGFLSASVSNVDNNIYLKLFRGGSEITAASSSVPLSNQDSAHSAGYIRRDFQTSSIPFLFFDSPNSTSQQTYQIFVSHSSGSNSTIYVNRNDYDNNDGTQARLASFILLEEVSA
tara:strand:- start:374 stop:913 length:540 start_codon:yes stop_codon:yes gene_type:complete